jgi:two-component system, NtrC family, phosphoglycerate transport system sensor histidine kinase PgtB
MKVFRHSISRNLALSFITVGSLAILSALVAWLSYDRLGTEIEEISYGRIPALISASRVSEQGNIIVSSAPNLALAETVEQFETARNGLELEMARTVEALDEFQMHVGRSPELQSLLQDIVSNLARLDANVGLRLSEGARLRQWMSELRWLHADYLDEAEPLISDARFAIELATDRLSGDPSAALATQLEIESRKFETVVSANANTQTAISLMSRIVTVESREEMASATAFLQDVADVIAQHSVTLEAWPDTVTLRQIGERLVQLSDVESGIPFLRGGYLDAKAEGAALLAENRDLIARLNRSIEAQVSTIQDAARDSLTAARNAMDFGRISILAAAILSLMVSIAIGWSYIHRNLSRRIVNLSQSAGAIASGDFSQQVVREGDDEIAKMAVTLERYRRTALEIERANSQAIIDNANVGLMTTDSHGSVEVHNPLAAELLGHNKDVTGVNLANYAAELETVFSSPHQQQTPVIIEVNCVDPTGCARPLEFCIRPFRRRTRTGFVVTINDLSERKNTENMLEQRVADRTADLRKTNRRLKSEITRHKQTEQELRETQEELVQAAKLAALGQLAAGIGHELNQPLSAIRFYARNGQIFAEQGRMEEALDNFEKIGELASRMGEITNHLKRFARRPDLELEPTGVLEVVQRAIALFGPRFEVEGIRVSQPELLHPVHVIAEDIRLEQVLVNLLSNAADATVKTADKQISIDVTSEDRWINIDVSDSGHGVTDLQRSKIFDPFFTTKEVGAGLGLGLSISYNIVRDFGGQFELLASSNQGSTFRVRLLRAG